MNDLLPKRGGLRLATIFLAAGFSCFPPPHLNTQADRNETLLNDSSKVSLYIPLQKVAVIIKDETKFPNPPVISEAFFIEVANALSQYEVSRRFKVMHAPVSDTSSIAATTKADSLMNFFRSTIAADSGSPEKVGATIRSIAEQCSVDLIILPLKASVKETLRRPQGWRHDKYGQSYERPINCVAEASIALQIWDRKGNMVYRNTGRGTTRQPLFYSLLKREKPKKEDLVHFSKNVFAPPLIRALSSAVKEVFPTQRIVVRGKRN